MQQIYKRTPMLKCDFTLWHGCSPVNLLHIYRTPFPKNNPGGLLVKLTRGVFRNQSNILDETFSKNIQQLSIVIFKTMMKIFQTHKKNLDNYVIKSDIYQVLEICQFFQADDNKTYDLFLNAYSKQQFEQSVFIILTITLFIPVHGKQKFLEDVGAGLVLSSHAKQS